MSVIWLIIKIILWVLISIIALLITLTTIILVSPIKYEAYFSKEDNVNYEVKVKYLKFIVANFIKQDEYGLNTVKILGKSVYNSESKLDEDDTRLNDYSDELLSETDIEQKNLKSQSNNINDFKRDKDSSKVDTKNNTTISCNKDDKTNISYKSSETNKADITDKSNQNGKPHETLKNKKVNKSDKTNKTNTKDSSSKDKLNTDNNTKKNNINLKQFSPREIYDALVCTVKFIKQLLVYIFPKDFSFEIVVGKEDPADTGYLVSELIMLYPLYHKYGIIRGDYEKEGIRGGFFAQGKFNLFRVLIITIRFLIRTPVRNIIKKVS